MICQLLSSFYRELSKVKFRGVMSLTVEICSKLGEYREGRKIRTFQHPDLNFKLVVFTSLFKFQVGCLHTNTLDETKKLSQATSLKLNINRNF